MAKVLGVIKRKEFIIFAVILIVVILYVLFLKPNPIIRTGANISPANSQSALSIVAPEEVNGVGEKFQVKIVVDTMGNAVNAVQSHLVFDSKALEVVSTDTSGSFCKFYPENNFSNDKGIVKLACGSPYPGFKGKNDLIVIDFIAKAIKTTVIRLNEESKVLANDGKGSNLLKVLPSADIKIRAGL